MPDIAPHQADAVRLKLNQALNWFVAEHHVQFRETTPANNREWARAVRDRANALLAALGVPSNQVNADSLATEALSALNYTREPDAFEALQQAAAGVKLIACHAEGAAHEFARLGRRVRKPDGAMFWLCWRLIEAFEEAGGAATTRNDLVATAPDKWQRGGALIEFVQGALALLRDRLSETDLAADPTLKRALKPTNDALQKRLEVARAALEKHRTKTRAIPS